jgi:hypothetical protein
MEIIQTYVKPVLITIFGIILNRKHSLLFLNLYPYEKVKIFSQILHSNSILYLVLLIQ